SGEAAGDRQRVGAIDRNRVGKGTAAEEKCEARQQRLLDIWPDRLLEELRLMDAPAMRKLESCPDRMAAERMLPVKTRATTVKRYEAKSVSVPGAEADLIDHLMVRREEPCGPRQGGRAVWLVKDRIVEALSKNAPVTKRAPPVYLLATIEGYVMDESELAVWRVVARSKLVEVWACLRWDDLQSTKPAELTFADGRLTTILRKTKTSGPNRSVKELPVCVSARALFLDSRWLGWGFQGDSCVRKMAEYGHAVGYTAG
ncbi:unnamed protein product, partial [Symbiodinium pilosum]